MSSRLHSKYHRHNHHTLSINDPRYPDAGHDPIASPESPFLGTFVLNGALSAIQGVVAYPLEGSDTAIEANGDVEVAGGINVEGVASFSGNTTFATTITAADIVFTGTITRVFSNPLETTEEFLVVNVNGQQRFVRLWNLR
jgi:hypothetical protein